MYNYLNRVNKKIAKDFKIKEMNKRIFNKLTSKITKKLIKEKTFSLILI